MLREVGSAPGLEEACLYKVAANGIDLQFADTGGSGPLVVFLHGWPELWYSWRHQMRACFYAGFRAVAPDMRGYGGSSRPQHAEEFTVHVVAADVLALAAALGYARFAVVGHDWGAWLAWELALLHPRHVAVVCGMSVPYVGRTSPGLLTLLKRKFGDPEAGTDEARGAAKFNYMLHHTLPAAERDYDQHVEDTLYRLYFHRPGVPCAPAEVQSPLMYVDGEAVGMRRRLPRPLAAAPWLPPADFQHFVREYQRTGFASSLNWYKTGDMNARVTGHLEGRKLTQAVLFIAGESDFVIQVHGGRDKCTAGLQMSCEQSPQVVWIPEVGHWVQQEAPGQVSWELLAFLSANRHLLPRKMTSSL